MLSRILSLSPQSFVHCGASPRMIHTKQRYWSVKDDIAFLTDIVSAYIDNPDRLYDITHSDGFNILELIDIGSNLYVNNKDLVKILDVYKPTYDECMKIMLFLIMTKGLTATIYDAFIRYYPQLSVLIKEDTIHNTFIHHRFKHMPIPQFDEDDLFAMIYHSVEEFLYVFPTQEATISLLRNEILSVDLRILECVLDGINPRLYPLAYWRLYGKFPEIDMIDDFTVAFYVRKYDHELYKTLHKDITNVDMYDFSYINTSTDLDVMLDVINDCYHSTLGEILEMIRDSDEHSHINHWLTVIIYTDGYREGKYGRIHLDGCNACQYFLTKI